MSTTFTDEMRMEVVRGDDVTYDIKIEDNDGNVIDLTGGTLFITVKKHLDDLDEDALITKDITAFDAPITGIQAVEFTNDDTDLIARTYFFDIQFRDEQDQIVSSQRGAFIVKRDVTIREVAS